MPSIPPDLYQPASELKALIARYGRERVADNLLDIVLADPDPDDPMPWYVNVLRHRLRQAPIPTEGT